MDVLALGALAGMTRGEVAAHIRDEYLMSGILTSAPRLQELDVLIAYQCDDDQIDEKHSWFLLKGKENGQLYESSGVLHVDLGYQGQFWPEDINCLHLLARFGFSSKNKPILSTHDYDAEVLKYVPELYERRPSAQNS